MSRLTSLGFTSENPVGSNEWHKDRRAFIKEWCPDWYEEQKRASRIRGRIRYRQRNGWDNYKHQLIIAKGAKCCECGIKYTGFNIAIFDFHHVGQKDFNMATQCRNSKDFTALQEEAEKCIIVCSNCHRLIHFNEMKTRSGETQA